MLLRFDPFRELDRAFERPLPGPLPMDAVRRGDEIVVSLDLPGVPRDAIDITVERNVLTVRAERRAERHDGDKVIAAERAHGTVSRQLLLGDVLDGDNVVADHVDGVLTLRIPVARAAQPRKVAIGAGAPAIDAEVTADEPAPA